MALKAMGKKLKSAAARQLNLKRLEKATIIVIQKEVASTKIQVQFNPSSYKISRTVRQAIQKPVGKGFHWASTQVVHGNEAMLSVDLHFDAYTDLHSLSLSDARDVVETFRASPKAGFGALASRGAAFFLPEMHSEVGSVLDQVLDLIQYDEKVHAPPLMVFLWGDLNFCGRVASSEVEYTMFDTDGTPIRAMVHLRVAGEQRESIRAGQMYPNESPDRTKQRMLGSGDQIWMMANREYGDPGMWKTIAAANGIQNPRKLAGAVKLKVPSIT